MVELGWTLMIKKIKLNGNNLFLIKNNMTTIKDSLRKQTLKRAVRYLPAIMKKAEKEIYGGEKRYLTAEELVVYLIEKYGDRAMVESLG